MRWPSRRRTVADRRVLSAERRRALLGWGRDHGAIVIADDFDAEYRCDHQPIGSLQGPAPEHVI
jgi:GntR family transcriptional regulator/MocR family aminotransferase